MSPTYGQVLSVLLGNVYLVIVLGLFFVQRKKFPICGLTGTPLELTLVIVQAVGHILYININSLFITGIDCTWAIWNSAICSFTISIPYILRAYWLLERYDVEIIYRTALVTTLLKMGNIKKKKISFITKMSIGWYALVFVIYLIAYSVDFDMYLSHCNGAMYNTSSFSFKAIAACFILQALAFIRFFIEFIVKKMRDALSIQYELIYQVIMGIVVAVVIFAHLPIESGLVIVVMVSLNFTLSFTVPLVSSFSKHEPITKLKFENVLENALFLHEFMKFCIKGFCTEQPLCYKEVKDYQNKYPTIDDEKRENKANEIYHKYFVDEAPLQVSVSDTIRNEIKNHIDRHAFPQNIFDEALDYVVESMKSDIYFRWTQSAEFNKFMASH